jgi:hypothetical protein
MRIPSGVTDQVIYFVAVDSTDLKTRETGLTTFTVYRSRNGGAAAAFTTPTVTEVDATNMPGVYKLLLDEDMTIDAGDDSQEYCVHITQAAMAPVTRTFELYRPKITAGETITAANGCADADIERLQGSAIATPSVAGVLEVDMTHLLGTAAATPTVAGVLEVDVTHWRGTAAAAPTVAGVPAVEVIDIAAAGQTDIRSAVGLATANLDTQLTAIDDLIDTEVAAIKTVVDAILVDTGTDIPATLATIAGYIDTEVTAIIAAIAALNNLSAAQVATEIADALATDTYAEPGQGAPAATASLAAKINYLYKAWRNKKTQTATTHSLFADDGTTVDQKSTVSDDGTTATRGEMVTGP